MNKNWSSSLHLVSMAVLLLAVAAPAQAQGTREEQLAHERAEKAKVLHAYVPDKLERRIGTVINLFSSDRSLYPFAGGLFDGSGIGVGLGYRQRFAGSGNVSATAARSIDGGTGAQAAITLPGLLDGRVMFETTGNWLDTRAMHSYPTGNASSEDRFDLVYRSTSGGVTGRVRLARHLEAGAGVDAIAVRTDDVDPTYTRARVFAKFDSRKPGRYTRSGGLYCVDATLYHQVNEGASSFQRFDAEANQFIPIFRDNWVIALRAKASTTETAAGQDVPIFLLPTLGGGKGLRGYPSGRYRDRASLLFSAEYRWTAGPFLDMALFVDAGRVAPELSALNLRTLTRSYGIGATIHSFDTSILRIDVARTSRGPRFLVSLNPGF